MTREKAISWLVSLTEHEGEDIPIYDTDVEALNMAIKALEQKPQTFKWCTDCREYDQEKHCCYRWSKVIRDTVEEMRQELKPMVEIDLYSVIKQKYIEREVLDKIRGEIANYGSIWVTYAITGRKDSDIEKLIKGVLKQAKEQVLDIIDKYRAEQEADNGNDD